MLLAGGRLDSPGMLILNCHFCLKKELCTNALFSFKSNSSVMHWISTSVWRKKNDSPLSTTHTHKAPVSLFPWLHLAARSCLCVHKAARRKSVVPRCVIGLSCNPLWWTYWKMTVFLPHQDLGCIDDHLSVRFNPVSDAHLQCSYQWGKCWTSLMRLESQSWTICWEKIILLW